jgi:hypothetical protein
MEKETYIQIRDAVKSEIKRMTVDHTHNKRTLRYNQSPKNPIKKTYLENGKPRELSIDWAQSHESTTKQAITKIHRFYNRLRNRPSHDGQECSDYIYGICLKRYEEKRG